MCNDWTSPSIPVKATMDVGGICRMGRFRTWINDRPLPNRRSTARTTQFLPAMARTDPPFIVNGLCWAMTTTWKQLNDEEAAKIPSTMITPATLLLQNIPFRIDPPMGGLLIRVASRDRFMWIFRMTMMMFTISELTYEMFHVLDQRECNKNDTTSIRDTRPYFMEFKNLSGVLLSTGMTKVSFRYRYDHNTRTYAASQKESCGHQHEPILESFVGVRLFSCCCVIYIYIYIFVILGKKHVILFIRSMVRVCVLLLLLYSWYIPVVGPDYHLVPLVVMYTSPNYNIDMFLMAPFLEHLFFLFQNFKVLPVWHVPNLVQPHCSYNVALPRRTAVAKKRRKSMKCPLDWVKYLTSVNPIIW